MKNWKDTLVKKDDSIFTTMGIIDASAVQIALVVDEQGKLLGTVTDGDVRKALLRGISLEEKNESIMNRNPVVARINEGRESLLAKMRNKRLHQIPVLDQQDYLVGLEILDEMVETNESDNWIFLMVGGLGSRLGALTASCPKPLLNVGNKPILETIIESFAECGYRKFYLSVNYKADMIQEYFQNGENWGVEIRYICENKRMGTAGALSLLSERPNSPMIVMNGDILTKVNFNQLINFHESHKAKATMCVRDYSVQVPYGVVQIDDHKLTGIVEKPQQSFFVSAGIYVLDPSVLDLIPKNEYLDMPDLFKKLISERDNILVFPVREYWLDIGNKIDFEKANGDYELIFNW
ncbi:CBS domain-containing protein [Pelosinus fermentans]|uniref:nucleotidyltransferase family protein n=1 Tax=Pelosinus fermentans TaxID=365349 RepID=UPI0002685C26|nr:nucleotidyltransferase family protein [Pelosinus fermentans]OAM92780.1 putative signal transduction protein with CBS domain containing protein [Pelosinus fermentans DSM 17108]SDQ56618.1 CBS domain-containing protein [Pelosinus fermentans]